MHHAAPHGIERDAIVASHHYICITRAFLLVLTPGACVEPPSRATHSVGRRGTAPDALNLREFCIAAPARDAVPARRCGDSR
ncbi:hypothetical protein, partial [Burkholderia multivorans]|uniref:hypothetical protein n=1 Tax=Burkholderia multivorans TaxID=87883 RepID=UPI00195521E4